MKRIWVIAAVVVLTGCATAVPVTARFPEPPGKMATTPCPDLKKLEDAAALSDVSRTVNTNYSMYYECRVKNDAWIEWYQIQRHLFEQVQK